MDETVKCQWCASARAETDAVAAKFNIKPGAMPIPPDRLPQFLDEDGVLVALSGKPGIFAHSSEDSHWPCPRFGAVVWFPTTVVRE